MFVRLPIVAFEAINHILFKSHITFRLSAITPPPLAQEAITQENNRKTEKAGIFASFITNSLEAFPTVILYPHSKIRRLSALLPGVFHQGGHGDYPVAFPDQSVQKDVNAEVQIVRTSAGKDAQPDGDDGARPFPVDDPVDNVAG
jgi:hypothetical protein